MTGVDPQLRMARDIADQFRHLPAEQAADAVADHVRAFWDPRMRAALLARVREGAASIDHPIDPVVAAAAARLG